LQVFHGADEKITPMAGGLGDAIKDLALEGIGKINRDIAAKYNIKASQGFHGVLEIEFLQTHHFFDIFIDASDSIIIDASPGKDLTAPNINIIG